MEIRNSKEKKSLIGLVHSPANNIMMGRTINKEITDACKNGTAIIMGDFNPHVNCSNQVGQGSLERSSQNVSTIASLNSM